MFTLEKWHKVKMSQSLTFQNNMCKNFRNKIMHNYYLLSYILVVVVYENTKYKKVIFLSVILIIKMYSVEKNFEMVGNWNFYILLEERKMEI